MLPRRPLSLPCRTNREQRGATIRRTPSGRQASRGPPPEARYFDLLALKVDEASGGRADPSTIHDSRGGPWAGDAGFRPWSRPAGHRWRTEVARPRCPRQLPVTLAQRDDGGGETNAQWPRATRRRVTAGPLQRRRSGCGSSNHVESGPRTCAPVIPARGSRQSEAVAAPVVSSYGGERCHVRSGTAGAATLPARACTVRPP